MITVVIPTYNGLHHLIPCLQSLATQTFTEYKIIIVDNGSTDGTQDYLKHHFADIQVIELDKNYGFSVAVNHGIRAASSEYIALLNNDTVVDAEWLHSLYTAIRTDESIGSCASRIVLLDPANHIDTVGDGFTIAGFGYKHGWLCEDDSRYDVSIEVFGACAAAALFRKHVFDKIGLFDEDFFAFEEDLDIAFRAQLAGYRCVYVPQARILHKLRATAGQGSALSLYLCYRNLTVLLYKNMPSALLILYLPHILLHTLGVLVRHLVKGQLLLVLKAYMHGLQRLPAVKAERKRIQQQRTISLRTLRGKLDGNWIAILFSLSSSVRKGKKWWRNFRGV